MQKPKNINNNSKPQWRGPRSIIRTVQWGNVFRRGSGRKRPINLNRPKK